MNITAQRAALNARRRVELEVLGIMTALDDDATRVTCRSYIVSKDGDVIQFPQQELSPAWAVFQVRQHAAADPANLWSGVDVELDGIGIYDELLVWADSERGSAAVTAIYRALVGEGAA